MNAFDYDVDDEELLPSNETKAAFEPSKTKMIGQKGRSAVEAADGESSTKTARKPRPKLDFNRLLNGRKGLGYLALFTRKSLKLSGKPGAEASDLSQISVFLQEWAKQVFPKMPLIDLLLKVEEICQGRVMKACIPQILAKLQEMGEDVNFNDLEVVESEVKTRLATSEAEKAIEKLSGIENGSESTSESTSKRPTASSAARTTFNSLDFDLEDALARNRLERPEFTDSSSDESEDADESDLAKELEGFINDNSESEIEDFNNNSESDADSKISESDEDDEKEPPKSKRHVTFDFDDDNESESEEVKAKDIVTDVNIKKRKISSAIIMDSSDSE